MDPIFYYIIAMRYSAFEGKPQTGEQEQNNEGFDPFILVFVFVGLFVLIVAFVVGVLLYRKRRHIKELQVTYVVNPNVQSDGSSGNEIMVRIY